MKLFAFLLPLVVLSSLMLETSTAHAQDGTRTPIADGTLGTQVFGGNGNFAITGGVSRGQNLFHSFQDFSVPTNGSATFINPVDNRSIITRVTGGMFSDINGSVITQGANFLLINPNGVVFGPNVRLDVGRLFLASTASSIDLVDGGGRTITFGTNPLGDTPFLTVNPNVLFNVSRLNLGGGGGEIRNFGVLQTGNANQYIGLIGGNVTVSGGQINALGGRVELGGLSAPGSVALGVEGNSPRVSIPQDVTRSNVLITGRALVDVRGNGGGDIAINARNIQLLGSSLLQGGIFPGVGAPDTIAGDINLRATERILVDSGSSVLNAVFQNSTGKGGNVTVEANNVALQSGSSLSASTFGLGSAGNVTVSAGQNVSILGSNIFSNVEVGGSGRGGNININADSLSLQGTNLQRTNLQALTRGRAGFETRVGNGNAGNINLRVNGITDVANSIISSEVEAGVIGDAGNITVNTGSLSLRGGTRLTSSTFGIGNSGNVNIATKDSASFNNANIFSNVEAGGVGKGGDITIEAGGSLSLQTGSALQSQTLSGGQGDAGNISVKVAGLFTVAGTNTIIDANGQSQTVVGGINSSIAAGSTGNAGKVTVDVGSLSFRDGAVLNTSTSGRGNAGDVSVTIKDSAFFDRANILTGVPSGVGKGGNINVETGGSLSLQNGSTLQSRTLFGGQGDAGNISVKVGGLFDVAGTDNGSVGGINSEIGAGSAGNAGRVYVESGSLSLKDGAFISASTAGNGNANDVAVAVTDVINLTNSASIRSRVETGAVGNAGNVSIDAGSLSLRDSAFLTSSTLGRGNAGNVTVNAKNTVALIGSATGGDTVISSEVRDGGVGKGGNIEINSNSLSLQDGAQIRAAVREPNILTGAPAGRGAAGNINIQVAENVDLFGIIRIDGVNSRPSGVGSTLGAGATGSGGNITVNAGSLSLRDNAFLTSSTLGAGDAGRVDVTAKNLVSLNRANISSTVGQGAVGNGGGIKVDTGSLLLQNGAQLDSSTFGRGNAGNVDVTAKDSISFDNGNIFSRIVSGATGNGGNITIEAGSLSLQNSSVIRTSTNGGAGDVLAGIGDAGNVNVKVAGLIDIAGTRTEFNPNGESKIFVGGINSSTEQGSTGNAGHVNIEAGALSLRDGSVITSSTAGQGNANEVIVAVKDSVSLVGRNTSIRSIVDTTAVGNGGNVTVNSGSLSLKDASFLASSAFGRGNAGGINVTVKDSVSLDNAGLASIISSGGVGDGGGIKVDGGSLLLQNGAQLNSSTFGRGNAGNITVNAKNTIVLTGSAAGGDTVISSEVRDGGVGKGGNIEINSNSLSLQDGAQIRAAVREMDSLTGAPAGRGTAGNINIQVAENVDLFGIIRIDGINSRPSGVGSTLGAGATGSGGNITVNAGSLSLRDNAFLTSSTSGAGDAGIVDVTAKNLVSLVDRANISSTVVRGAVGNGGGIKVETDSLVVQNGAEINSSTFGNGNAGSVAVTTKDSISLDNAGLASVVGSSGIGDGGGIKIDTGSLVVQNGAQLNSSTFGRGNAGNITVNAKNTIALIGSATGGDTVISSEVRDGGVGKGGSIEVSSNSLLLQDGAQIRAAVREAVPPTETEMGSLAGKGDAGSITVKVRGTVDLSGAGDRPSAIGSDVSVGAEGNGGNISIDAGSLSLQDGAFLSAFNGGKGNAGNIFLTTKESVSLADARIFSNKFGSVGQGGSVTINADSLSLKDTSTIVSATSGEGNAGNVAVTAKNVISLDSNSEITSEVLPGGVGKGGNIDISSNSLSLRDGSQLRAATREADILTEALAGRGDAGNISVTATGAVELFGIRNDHSSAIGNSIELGATGNSGNITVNAGTLSLRDGAFLTASTDGQGNAGTVAVNANNSLLISGKNGDSNSRLSVRSGSTTGTAGNVIVNSPRITLENSGRIESTSNSGSGGDIDINNKINAPLSANSIPNGGDTLILRSGAQISANSRGESQEGSSGGNININSNFIIAVPSENSDITADANRGRGGNININSQLFGIQNRPSNPNNSGITASSEFGQSGSINLNTLGIDPGKDIGELPVAPIDASKQIAQACSSSQLSNKFYITGRGGHPPNANEQLSSEAIWSDPRNTKPQIASNSSTPTSNKLPEPAIRMVFDGKGNASLIANNSDAETNRIKIACPNSHKLSASSTQ